MVHSNRPSFDLQEESAVSKGTEQLPMQPVPSGLLFDVQQHPQEPLQAGMPDHLPGCFTHLDPIEVINSENGAPLVLIAQKTKAFRLSSLLVPHQVNVDDLPIPATHS